MKADFGTGFKWGVAASSYQTEGAWNVDGKSESNWDFFSRIHGKIERVENADVAADFYHRYAEDIDSIKAMNFKVLRFSLSWPRIMPEGTGAVNKKGIDFYHKVIDKCRSAGIEPWVTIYHWDMPQVLEARGGWANRKIVDWFSEYADVVTKEYGSKVKNWMVINEQLSFTGGGYMQGIFAPGKKNLKAFMKSVHNSVLCNAEGGRIILLGLVLTGLTLWLYRRCSLTMPVWGRAVMTALREVIERKGRFCALYSDRASHFFHTPAAGGPVSRERLSQVGRALQGHRR